MRVPDGVRPLPQLRASQHQRPPAGGHPTRSLPPQEPGAAVTALRRWVDYARPQEAVIVYDAAYEAYIRDAEIPRSIYEVEGAREVTIESRSFSKSAGFTGLRMAYTVVPREAQSRSRAGDVVSLNQLWLRRQSTKSNGPPYVIQRAGPRVLRSA
jgi:LL-diaminopimelate aminotransferase